MTVTFSNAYEQESASQPVTITLNNARSGGQFSGSYVVQGSGSGVINGVLRSDGGIEITTFGSATSSPGMSDQYLQNLYSHCDLYAAGSTAFSGSVAGRSINVGASISFPCYYTDGYQTMTAPTTLNLQIVGSR